MERFYLVEDPKTGGSDLFILHTIYPECLIRLIFVPDEEPGDYEDSIRFDYENSDGVNEEWILQVVRNYHNTSIDELYYVIALAWEWYKSYLEWEDENIDEGDEAILN